MTDTENINFTDQEVCTWRLGEDSLEYGDLLFNPRTCEYFKVGASGTDIEYVKPAVSRLKALYYKVFPSRDGRIASPVRTDDYFVVMPGGI